MAPLLAWTCLCCPATATGPQVLPATMTVEVTSLRNGAEAGRIVANTRPGERVLLRDEQAVPYRVEATAGRSASASVPVGLVTVVTPEIRQGALVFAFSTTVRQVAGFEPSAGAAATRVPAVSSALFEAEIPAGYEAGTFTGRQDLQGTGFSVRVKVRALTPKR